MRAGDDEVELVAVIAVAGARREEDDGLYRGDGQDSAAPLHPAGVWKLEIDFLDS